VYGGGVDISSNSVIKGSDMNVDALDITTGVCASDDPYFLVAVEAGNGVYKLTPDGVFSFISATLAAGDSAADKAMQLREQDEEGLLVYNSGDWGEAVPFTEVEKVDIDRDGNAVVTGTLGTKGLDEMSRGFTIKYTKSPDCPFGYTFEELELK
nr:hypothetical protein [Lachnospiraceae bacterium]